MMFTAGILAYIALWMMVAWILLQTLEPGPPGKSFPVAVAA